jgi:hypothetical protein
MGQKHRRKVRLLHRMGGRRRVGWEKNKKKQKFGITCPPIPKKLLLTTVKTILNANREYKNSETTKIRKLEQQFKKKCPPVKRTKYEKDGGGKGKRYREERVGKGRTKKYIRDIRRVNISNVRHSVPLCYKKERVVINLISILIIINSYVYLSLIMPLYNNQAGCHDKYAPVGKHRVKGHCVQRKIRRTQVYGDRNTVKLSTQLSFVNIINVYLVIKLKEKPNIVIIGSIMLVCNCTGIMGGNYSAESKWHCKIFWVKDWKYNEKPNLLINDRIFWIYWLLYYKCNGMDTAQVNGLMVIIYNVKNKRQSKLFYGKFWTYSVYQFNWEVMSKKNIERGQGLGINKIATVLVKMEISIPEIKATVTRNYRKMSDQGNSNPAAGECDNYNCYELPLTVDMCMFTVTVASINVKIFNVYGAIRGVYKTRLISVKDWLCYTWIFIKMDKMDLSYKNV